MIKKLLKKRKNIQILLILPNLSDEIMYESKGKKKGCIRIPFI